MKLFLLKCKFLITENKEKYVRFLFILFLFILSGGISNFSEHLIKKQGDIANITFAVNGTEISTFSEKVTIVYDVCKSNTLSVQCTFKWREQLNQLAVKKWSSEDDAFCSAERRNFTSVVTWEITISQVVSRSLSLMHLYLENNTGDERRIQMMRLIRVQLLRKSGMRLWNWRYYYNEIYTM